jgi:formyl-CoA transferase
MDLVRADEDTTPARSVAGMGDHPCAMALYSAIVTALFKREKTGKGSHVATNLMANGIWASGVLAQAKLCGAKFQKRKPREAALNAVTNHINAGRRWIILSLLSQERQWPAFARCIGREDLVNDEPPLPPEGAPRPVRGADQDPDEAFAGGSAEWRRPRRQRWCSA